MSIVIPAAIGSIATLLVVRSIRDYRRKTALHRAFKILSKRHGGIIEATREPVIRGLSNDPHWLRKHIESLEKK